MKCLKCGFNNPRGSKFCNQCGTPLISPPLIEDRLSFAQSYIPKKLREKISSLRIEGERKNVTVLFADISGFTALSEKLDPEEVTDLINRCFKVLIDAIYKYEGTIDKFIGDCIMALFGAPITHEDDPERAVHTSLEIMSALDLFNGEHGTNLSIHIGINSGKVIAGGVGSDLRMEYTVMGDTVNLASRLMDLAKDEIIVSESIYKKTGYLFEIHKLKPVKVKGKTKKVIPYRVIGIKEMPKRKRGISELYSPLVGRQKELTSIKSVVKSVIKGNSAVLVIQGEAGVGKSRLIEELIEATSKKVLWLSGRSFSYGTTIPFWVIREQIRNYLCISERGRELESAKLLKKSAKKLFGKKINEYLPYLSTFLSIKVPKQLEKKVKYLDFESLRLQEFVSVKVLFRTISRKKPIILYFEDLQWIDPESIELLRFLLDGLRNVPVLFLFETRPPKKGGSFLIKSFITKISNKRYLKINLKPLDHNETNELIQNYLCKKGYPQNLPGLIHEKSEGNPFYIGEIILSLIGSGLLKKGKELLNSDEDIGYFEVPETVEAVIRSRIDSLTSKPKDVLGNASVIGRNFHYQILSHIINLKNIYIPLKILEQGEFIKKKKFKRPFYPNSGTEEKYILPPKSRLLTDLDYVFKHTLIRDVTYKGILKKKRREIHQKIAIYLEEKFRDKLEDYYKLLGNHYYHAEIFAKSLKYYKKAGDNAKKFYLNNIAIECYTKAIEIYKKILPDEKEKMAELFEKNGDVKVITAEYDKAFKYYQTAYDYYKDIEKKSEIKRKIGNIFSYKSEYDKAISFYEESIEMLKAKPSSPVLFETSMYYAFLLSVGKSEHSRAEKITEQILEKIKKKKKHKIFAQALNNLGAISYNRGDYDKALKHYQKTLTIFETLNNKKGIATASKNIGVVYSHKGELEKALEHYKKHLTISEEIGDKREIGTASNNIGILYWNKGNLDIALRYYKKHLDIAEEIGDKRGIGAASNNIGLVYWNQGNLDAALKYYKRYLTISEEIGFKIGIGRASGNIGGVYHHKGALDTALKYYKRHLAISKKIGRKLEIGIASNNIGAVYRDKGKLKTSLSYYNRYLSISEEIGYKMGIGIALIGLGSVYKDCGKIVMAKKHLKKAEKTLIEIGDKINLAEVFICQSELNSTIKDYKLALSFGEKSLSLAREANVKPQEILALRAIGTALFKVSKKKIENGKQKKQATYQNVKESIHYLKKSISLAKKQNMRLELAKSLYKTAKILSEIGKKKEGEKYLKEAKIIFQKAGVKNWQ